MPSPLTPLTLSPHLSIPPQAIDFPSIRIVFFSAFRIRIRVEPKLCREKVKQRPHRQTCQVVFIIFLIFLFGIE